MTGSDGANRLDGDAGNDVLAGGLGKDKLVGGKGRDSFLFNSDLGTANADKITDFKKADSFLLDDAIFGGLGLGDLKKNAYFEGPRPTTPTTASSSPTRASSSSIRWQGRRQGGPLRQGRQGRRPLPQRLHRDLTSTTAAELRTAKAPAAPSRGPLAPQGVQTHGHARVFRPRASRQYDDRLTTKTIPR